MRFQHEQGQTQTIWQGGSYWFELDLKTTSTHVLGTNEIDHDSKKYPQDAKDWVEGTIACALNDFYVLEINIDFALIQEVDVKVG
jgi:hypothetical protein